MEMIAFLIILGIVVLVGAFAARFTSRWEQIHREVDSGNSPDPAHLQATDLHSASPEELGDYYKSRTDIPVDSGGFYQGQDEENIAAVVRAAFLSGGVVVGNVNENGELEIILHPTPKGNN